MKRRDFFTLTGTALGGLVVASCDDSPTGPGGFGDDPVLPNGMAFYALKPSGDPLPGGSTLQRFRLDSALDGAGEIAYGVIGADDTVGVYGATVDFDRTPRIVSERMIAEVGQLLPDGRKVATIQNYDVNESGSLVIHLALEQGSAEDDRHEHAIYVDRSKGGLQGLVFPGQITADGHILENSIGDVDIHAGDDILFAAAYVHVTTTEGEESHEGVHTGVFHVPAGDASRTSLVTSTRSILSRSDLSASIGLIDMHDDGHYAVQTSTYRSDQIAGAGDGTGAGAGEDVLDSSSDVLTGRVGGGDRPQPAALAPSASLGRLLSFSTAGPDSIFGPRMGPAGAPAYVIHDTEDATALYYRGLRALTSGDTSPRGNVVQVIFPPVFGPGGEIYVRLITDRGDELMGLGGRQRRTILSRGDTLQGTDKPLESFMFGATTDAVDAQGNLVLVATFDDGSAALVVGVPR